MTDVILDSLHVAILGSEVDKIKNKHSVRIGRDIQLQTFQYRQNKDQQANFSPGPSEDTLKNVCDLKKPRI